jgi:hypothetical protein
VFNIQAHFKLMFEILQYVEVPIMWFPEENYGVLSRKHVLFL